MSDEAVLSLAAAIEKLAASINMKGGAGSGIHVYHHNAYPYQNGGAAGSPCVVQLSK